MPKQLLESDFITTDLRLLFKRNNDATNSDSEASEPADKDERKSTESEKESEATQADKDTQEGRKVGNWSAELDKRLAANKQLDSKSRKTEYEIETKFFEDYFTYGNASWDAECAKQLLRIGDPLRTVIKVLGYNINENPILGFITEQYVIDNLIQPGLLNASTFKAIYEAVRKKLIADSEFFDGENDYNILYCKDLYSKSASEMLEYFKLQSNILEVSAEEYPVAVQEKNKLVFIFEDSISEKDPEKRADAIKANSSTIRIDSVKNGKLNSISLAKGIYSTLNNIEVLDSDTAKQNILAKLKTPAEKLAALQYLSFNTNSKEARAALSNKAFKGITMDEIIQATTTVAKVMPKNKISAADADALAKLILDSVVKNQE